MARFIQSVLVPAMACVAALSVQAQERSPAVSSVGTLASVCASAADLTVAQRGVVQTAAQGVVPLRQFVDRTRLIFELDMMEVTTWLELRQGCAQRVSSAATRARK